MNSKEGFKREYLAYRYAQAFLNVCGDSLQKTDEAAMQKAALFFKTQRRTCLLMETSSVEGELKKKILERFRIDAGLSEIFEKLFLVILEHKRVVLLEDVFKQLFMEYIRRANKVCFSIISAGVLMPSDRQILQKFLEKKTQKTIECSFELDEGLLAGVRLQSDRFLWEASLRDRLNRVRCILRH